MTSEFERRFRDAAADSLGREAVRRWESKLRLNHHHGEVEVYRCRDGAREMVRLFWDRVPERLKTTAYLLRRSEDASVIEESADDHGFARLSGVLLYTEKSSHVQLPADLAVPVSSGNVWERTVWGQKMRDKKRERYIAETYEIWRKHGQRVPVVPITYSDPGWDRAEPTMFVGGDDDIITSVSFSGQHVPARLAQWLVKVGVTE